MVSLLLPRRHTQEPTRVELGEGADQQGTVWLLVMSKEASEKALKEENLGADLCPRVAPGLGRSVRALHSTLIHPALLLWTDATERERFSRPVAGQRDAISSPFNRDGGGRRRADSAGQHHRLAN